MKWCETDSPHPSLTPPYTNFQNAIPGQTGSWPAQFATSSTTTGIGPELDAAVTVFANSTPDACGSLSFWTPDYNNSQTPQWNAVQAAWQSGTTTFPSGTGAPTYDPSVWPTSTQQIVYISTVGTQPLNGAPNFLFLTVRGQSDHAVVSGVCP